MMGVGVGLGGLERLWAPLANGENGPAWRVCLSSDRLDSDTRSPSVWAQLARWGKITDRPSPKPDPL